jgi:tetratricopeptide (TPR) repeat protein
MKRNNPREAIKAAKEAIMNKKDNPKAFYRLALAQRANGELDQAKESLIAAIKLAPSDQNLRKEYSSLSELMNQKYKQWQQSLSGFYQSDRMSRIEKKDEEEALLKRKILQKEFGEDWVRENEFQ